MSSRRRAAEEELLERIRSREATCAVIGTGFIGSTLMDALISNSFEVHGYDRLAGAADAYRNRFGRQAIEAKAPWSVGTSDSVLDAADVVLVAVRTPVGPDGSADLEPLRNAAASLAAHARAPRLILVESTVPPGTTRSFANDWLGLGPESEQFVAHSPERLSVGHTFEDLRRIPHLAGGIDPGSTRLAQCLLAAICDEVVPVAQPEISEMSKLLENAFISLGVALAGEITRMAHALDVPAADVCAAAATKNVGYHAFHPGPGLGGHCLPADLRMLEATSRALGVESPLFEAAARVTELQPEVVVQRLEHLLEEAGARLTGARVLLVGVGFKVDTDDTTCTPAADVVRALRTRGANALYADSRVPEFSVDGRRVERCTPGDLRRDRFAAALVLAGDPEVETEELQDATELVLDTGGGRLLAGALRRAHTL